ncbi:contractile injection system tape measure protein [Shewanella surugensis]|uniref:Uncharacterized protein n=1 Tax=Shewanella surugensis TaxID=212020 RepID=A0ABT0L7R6_9GAMM|nr:contractile injection system tape measure protein [Shewanella surugensis]MCL1123738.1 hypothetical protein [Shewanella surugensis]
MAECEHLIEQATFDVTFDSQYQNDLFQMQAGRFMTQTILPLIDKVFSECAIHHQVIQIDKLEIDLGCIQGQDFFTQLEDKLPRVLKQTLLNLMSSASGCGVDNVVESVIDNVIDNRGEGETHIANKPLHSSLGATDNNPLVNIRHQQAIKWQQLSFYLLFGYLPWNVDQADFERNLSGYVLQYADHIYRYLLDKANTSTSSTSHQAKKRSDMVRRLILQLLPFALKRFFHGLLKRLSWGKGTISDIDNVDDMPFMIMCLGTLEDYLPTENVVGIRSHVEHWIQTGESHLKRQILNDQLKDQKQNIYPLASHANTHSWGVILPPRHGLQSHNVHNNTFPVSVAIDLHPQAEGQRFNQTSVSREPHITLDNMTSYHRPVLADDIVIQGKILQGLIESRKDKLFECWPLAMGPYRHFFIHAFRHHAQQSQRRGKLARVLSLSMLIDILKLLEPVEYVFIVELHRQLQSVETLTFEKSQSEKTSTALKEGLPSRVVHHDRQGKSVKHRQPAIASKGPLPIASLNGHFWEFTLGYLLVDRGSQFNRKSYLTHMIKNMASHHNVYAGQLHQSLCVSLAGVTKPSPLKLSMLQLLQDMDFQTRVIDEEQNVEEEIHKEISNEHIVQAFEEDPFWLYRLHTNKDKGIHEGIERLNALLIELIYAKNEPQLLTLLAQLTLNRPQGLQLVLSRLLLQSSIQRQLVVFISEKLFFTLLSLVDIMPNVVSLIQWLMKQEAMQCRLILTKAIKDDHHRQGLTAPMRVDRLAKMLDPPTMWQASLTYLCCYAGSQLCPVNYIAWLIDWLAQKSQCSYAMLLAILGRRTVSIGVSSPDDILFHSSVSQLIISESAIANGESRYDSDTRYKSGQYKRHKAVSAFPEPEQGHKGGEGEVGIAVSHDAALLSLEFSSLARASNTLLTTHDAFLVPATASLAYLNRVGPRLQDKRDNGSQDNFLPKVKEDRFVFLALFGEALKMRNVEQLQGVWPSLFQYADHQHNPHKTSIKHLLMHYGAQSNVRYFLSFHLTEQQLIQLCLLFVPAAGGLLRSMLELAPYCYLSPALFKAKSPHGHRMNANRSNGSREHDQGGHTGLSLMFNRACTVNKGDIAPYLWGATLSYLFLAKEKPFNSQSYLDSLIKQLAAHYNLHYGHFLHLVIQGLSTRSTVSFKLRRLNHMLIQSLNRLIEPHALVEKTDNRALGLLQKEVGLQAPRDDNEWDRMGHHTRHSDPDTVDIGSGVAILANAHVCEFHIERLLQIEEAQIHQVLNAERLYFSLWDRLKQSWIKPKSLKGAACDDQGQGDENEITVLSSGFTDDFILLAKVYPLLFWRLCLRLSHDKMPWAQVCGSFTSSQARRLSRLLCAFYQEAVSKAAFYKDSNQERYQASPVLRDHTQQANVITEDNNNHDCDSQKSETISLWFQSVADFECLSSALSPSACSSVERLSQAPPNKTPSTASHEIMVEDIPTRGPKRVSLRRKNKHYFLLVDALYAVMQRAEDHQAQQQGDPLRGNRRSDEQDLFVQQMQTCLDEAPEMVLRLFSALSEGALNMSPPHGVKSLEIASFTSLSQAECVLQQFDKADVLQRVVMFLPEEVLQHLLVLSKSTDYLKAQVLSDLLIQACYGLFSCTKELERLKWRYLYQFFILEERRFSQTVLTDLFVDFLLEVIPSSQYSPRLATLLSKPSLQANASKEALATVASTKECKQAMCHALKGYRLKEYQPEVEILKAILAPDIGSSVFNQQQQANKKLSTVKHSDQTSQWDFDPQVEEQSQRIYINNAGLVLIAPYIPRLLTVLGVVSPPQTHMIQDKQKAVHLLAQLVSGKDVNAEYLLVFNKLLCGLSLSMPISTSTDITLKEKQTIDNLLNSVITHWQAIGKTSISGFRETFLQRDGVLSKDNEKNHWHLQVQPKAFDMLLDKLPWSYSLIKLPWMECPLHVTWR